MYGDGQLIRPCSVNNPSATVALTRCGDYSNSNIEKAIQRQFQLLGGLESFISRGDSVLLKPNFIAPKPTQSAVQTDPAVILATARMVLDSGARPFVGDSPAWDNVFSCVKALRLDGPLKKLGVAVRQLNKPRRCRIAGSSIGISTVALQADKIINLPKLKTHQQLGATFAVKNIFGCVSGKEKAFWHFARGRQEDFCRMLIEIYKLLGPAVTIIDGVMAMQGTGPISGDTRKLGFLIGGKDPIACEMVCCELVNFEPEDLPVIRTAKQMDFGCRDISQISVAGDNIADCKCYDFQPARQVPLRFSLLRICKSAAKQIFLLAKSAPGKKTHTG